MRLERGGAARPVEERFEGVLRALVDGNRTLARTLVDASIEQEGAQAAIERLLWPVCATLHALSREDRLSAVAEHCATVLLSQLVQRAEERLPVTAIRRGRVVATSGPAPFEEIAGETFAALAEAAGFEVVFLAGGVESDDLLAEVGRRQPDFVVSFAAAGSDAPRLRRFIDALRTQQPVPGIRVGLGGGVFGRAPGLAEELGADFEGATPSDVVAGMLSLDRPDNGAARARRRAA